MPIPDIPERNDEELSEREHLMQGSEWIVEVSNYKEIGEAIASYSRIVDAYTFIGIAEVSLENGMRKLELTLYCDENQKFLCAICDKVPQYPTSNNPGICTFCGQKVCAQCWKAHEKSHWRPQKTIGGDIIGDNETPF